MKPGRRRGNPADRLEKCLSDGIDSAVRVHRRAHRPRLRPHLRLVASKSSVEHSSRTRRSGPRTKRDEQPQSDDHGAGAGRRDLAQTVQWHGAGPRVAEQFTRGCFVFSARTLAHYW